MSKKSKQTAVVISQEKLAEGIYDLWIETGLAKEAGAGQFIGVYPKNAATTIQNNAPGPPAAIAVATPAIFPVPMVADNAVQSAPKLVTSPCPSSSS
jgi:hypothetical protein